MGNEEHWDIGKERKETHDESMETTRGGMRKSYEIDEERNRRLYTHDAADDRYCVHLRRCHYSTDISLTL